MDTSTHLEDWTKDPVKHIKINNNNIINTSWSFYTDNLPEYAYNSNAFSTEECKNIIDIGNQTILQDATIAGEENLNLNIRNSKVGWIYPNSSTNWIFRRITDIVLDLNKTYYNFDLFGLVEGLQFTKYLAPDGKYDKHVDCGTRSTIRKLSFTVQLSSPKDYIGGDLCLYNSAKPCKIEKSQGLAVVFPSYTLHEVKPVTKGTRYSLVCWITGPNFR